MAPAPPKTAPMPALVCGRTAARRRKELMGEKEKSSRYGIKTVKRM